MEIHPTRVFVTRLPLPTNRQMHHLIISPMGNRFIVVTPEGHFAARREDEDLRSTLTSHTPTDVLIRAHSDEVLFVGNSVLCRYNIDERVIRNFDDQNHKNVARVMECLETGKILILTTKGDLVKEERRSDEPSAFNQIEAPTVQYLSSTTSPNIRWFISLNPVNKQIEIIDTEKGNHQTISTSIFPQNVHFIDNENFMVAGPKRVRWFKYEKGAWRHHGWLSLKVNARQCIGTRNHVFVRDTNDELHIYSIACVEGEKYFRITSTQTMRSMHHAIVDMKTSADKRFLYLACQTKRVDSNLPEHRSCVQTLDFGKADFGTGDIHTPLETLFKC